MRRSAPFALSIALAVAPCAAACNALLGHEEGQPATADAGDAGFPADREETADDASPIGAGDDALRDGSPADDVRRPADDAPADPRFAAWPMPNGGEAVDAGPGGPPHPTAYRYVTNAATEDAVTGLLWDTNVPGPPRTLVEARAHCASVPPVQGRAFRVPTRIELVSFVDYGRVNPAAYTSIFPLTPSELAWTSSTYAGPTGGLWNIDGADGKTAIYDDAPNAKRRVRCVAPKRPSATGRSPDAYHAVLGGLGMLDVHTGLVWQREITDVAKRYTWPTASTACEAMNQAEPRGWRVPTIKELQTLVDETRAPMAIEPAFPMPSTSETTFWASTPFAGAPQSEAWAVDFGSGEAVHIGHAQRSGYVRCVRNGI